MQRQFGSVLPAAAVMVAVGLVAAIAAVLLTGDSTKQAAAYFDQTSGLYVGNDVRVLGVPVGRVTAIEPEGTRVRVEMSYRAERDVPAGARAIIVQPTLLTGRYVQLAPVYRGGRTLPDGAVIPRSRTASPLGFDRTAEALNRLATSLGPQGANRNGALSRLLQVGADNLAGQGDDINRTVRELSRATQALAGNRQNLFATVRQLQQFTTALANSDQQVGAFNRDLATVSAQLANDREALGAALDNLAVALDAVERFVRDNRDELATNVDQLATVTDAVVAKKEQLAEILDTAGLGLANLAGAYGPRSGALRVRINAQQIQTPAMNICSLALSFGVPAQQCQPLLSPLEQVRMDQLPVGSNPAQQPVIGNPNPGRTQNPGGTRSSNPVGPPPGLGALLPGGDR